MKRINRREFLSIGGGAALLCGCRVAGTAATGEKPLVRFGMVTDIHFADIPQDPQPVGVVGIRYYRESKRKLDEAVAVFNSLDLDFAIELGDFKDLTEGRTRTLEHLRSIEASFAAFKGPRYHVTGNHDFDCLKAEEFFAELTNDGRPWTKGYYSFAKNGITFIVLDCCYDSRMRHYSENNPWDDANVPAEELAWLEAVLAAAKGPCVVITHQRLDPSADPRHLVKNSGAVRGILERSGKVKTVFTGHQHQGGINRERGISYYSLKALVCGSGEENNSYAVASIYADGSFSVEAWKNAVPYAK